MEFSKIIEKGLALGISEIEIYAESSVSNNIKLQKGKVENYSLNSIKSVAIVCILQHVEPKSKQQLWISYAHIERISMHISLAVKQSLCE